MGEYVCASIEIRGHIPTVEAFEDLVEAIESQSLGVWSHYVMESA